MLLASHRSPRLLILLVMLTLLLPGWSPRHTAQAAGNIVGSWSFEEGGGATATDSSGGGNHGTISGGATYTTSTPSILIGSSSALVLDGVNAYVTIPNETTFDLAQVTVAAWIKVSSFTRDWQAIVTKGDSSWRLHRASNSNVIAFGTNGLSNGDLTGTVNVNDGQWHHVAATYNGSRKALYIDGTLDVSVDVTGSLAQNDSPVMIGENAESDERYFHGAVDEVQIYSRALSAAEISVVGGFSGVRTVTTAADSGPGSLRQAIADAQDGETIKFADDFTIALSSSIELTKSLIIDGTARLITLDGALAGNAGQTGGILQISSGVTVTLQSITFANGTASEGGAIFNQGALIVDGATFLDNTAVKGGAISGSGNASITDTTFRGNSASENGGAIYSYGSPSGVSSMIIAGSTLVGNQAGYGGAIAMGYRGALSLENSTVAGNTATVSGGAIHFAMATVSLSNSTVAGNTSGLAGGQVSLAASNSIIADSTSGGDCSLGAANITLSATLIEDGGCGATISGDPRLSALGSYGGGVETFALLPGSQAIDAGDQAACLDSDQRGVSRPQGAGCDMGAFESKGFVLDVTSGANQATLPGTVFPVPLGVKLSANDSGVEVGAGAVITFTAPISGASLSIPSFTLTTDASSSVTATITANGSLGSYAVAASTRGVASPATFSLTNCSTSSLVSNAGDSGPGSLRQALADACPGNTITFAADYTIALSDHLRITRDVTVDGGGHAIVLDGSAYGESRGGLLNVDAGAVTLRGLTLRNGEAFEGLGGAIYSRGVLTIEDSTIRSNLAGSGGAIFNEGTLHITNTTILSNTAGNQAGAIFNEGTLYITSTSILSNTSRTLAGGIMSIGRLQMLGSRMEHNSVTTGDAGSMLIVDDEGISSIEKSSFASSSASMDGGAIISDARLTIADSSFTNTSAGDYGGAIFNWGILTVDNSSFTSSSAGQDGGAIFNLVTLTIDDSSFANTSAGRHGGAIFNVGMLTASNSSLTGGSARDDGGAIFSMGPLTVSGSTLAGNYAGENGGAIASSDTMTITNSTLSGNEADGNGGAILSDAILTLSHSTLSGNKAALGGALWNEAPAAQVLINSILANSSGGADCGQATPSITLTATLVEDGSCGATLTGDPRLSALGSYGGATQTHALLDDSPAVDAGDAAACAATDQRGVARPQGAGCDLGAYEQSLRRVFIPLVIRPQT